MKGLIGEYCIVEKGKIGITKAIPGSYPLVTTAEERLSHNEFHYDKPSVIIPVVSSTGHGHASLKRIHYQNGQFAVGSILAVVIPKDESVLNAEFLYHFLSLYKEELLVSRMKGMANVTLPLKEIESIEFPLMPIHKQKEWVLHLRSVQEKVGDLSTEITHQQDLLKKLRQQILQDAISGKLTAEWRKKKKHVEPASELLKRIQAEKVKLGIKQKPLAAIRKDEIPFDLPEGWVWCRLGEVTSLITSGSRNWKDYYSASGVPLIRSQDIKCDCLRYEDKVYVDVKGKVEGDRTRVQVGDWLITITGGNVGKCALINEDPGMAFVSQHVGLMRPVFTELSDFGHLWLVADKGGRELLSQFVYGDKPGLNLQQLNDLLYPLAPLAEQLECVRMIQSSLDIVSNLEDSDVQVFTQNLLQSILKEAFEA